MIVLDENINEIYTKEGKKINELVQEWIDENSNYLYCILNKEIVECKYR